MSRIARFLWRLWAAVSLLWVALVIFVPIQPPPSSSEAWRVITERMPPMRPYLEDMDDLCQLLTEDEVAALPGPPRFLQDYDFLQIPRDQLTVVSDMSWEDTLRAIEIFQNRSDETLSLHCAEQDYVGAAQARSADTQALREARAASIPFLRAVFIPPLILATLGLFLLWSPFQRHDDT